MKRKSLNLGSSRSGEDMDKVINKLNVKMSPEEESALKSKPKEEVEKVRVTHYLSTEILGEVEEFVFMRKLCRNVRHIHSQLVVEFDTDSSSLHRRMILEV